MKKVTLLFALLFGFTLTQAQWCGSLSPEETIWQDESLSQEEKETRVAALRKAQKEKFAKWDASSRSGEKADVLIIPVVFHIFHNFGEENISDEQVQDQIRQMNEDFTGTNEAREDVIEEFQDIVGNAEVEFRLATLDPDGNCTNGINRYYEPDTYFSSNGPIQQLKREVGWPSNRYMNAYVVGSISSGGGGRTLGYAQFPGFGDPRTDGIVMVHDAIGAIGTSNPRNAAVTTHEIGHWFGLFHTWGNCAAAGDEAACDCDDGVADTPLTTGHPSVCPLGAVTCNETLDNVQNFMDYSFCFANFTQGQTDRMRGILENDNSRSNLYTQENLVATGADYGINEPPTTLCEAEIEYNNTKTYCVGETVEFIDRSYHNITERTWTFEGGSITTSNEKNPSVTFTSPGVKNVTLEVSNGQTTLSTTVEVFVRGVDERGGFPFADDIEGVDLGSIAQYEVINNSGNVAWRVSDNVSNRGGSKSLFLNNRLSGQGDIDEVISNTIDLSGYSGTEGVDFQFDWAFARTDVSNADRLTLAYSNDCGVTWQSPNRGTLSRSFLSTVDQPTTSNFAPEGEDDWATRTYEIPEELLTENFQFKFTFQNGGGNNIYIDNIRINRSGFTSVSSLDDQMLGFDVYPVPVKGQLNLSFEMRSTEKLEISVLDITGRSMLTLANDEFAKGVHHINSKVDLPAGVYMVRAASEMGMKTKRIIVQ